MEREEIVMALRGECDDCSGLSDDGCRCDLPIYCPNRDAADLIEQQATRIAELEDKLQKAIADKEFAERKFDRAKKEFARLRQLDDVRFERLVKENEELRAVSSDRSALKEQEGTMQNNDLISRSAFELYCPHCGVKMDLEDDAK